MSEGREMTKAELIELVGLQINKIKSLEAGALLMASAAGDIALQRDRLRDALRELVELKEMSDSLSSHKLDEYARRKPRAWEVARAELEQADANEEWTPKAKELINRLMRGDD